MFIVILYPAAYFDIKQFNNIVPRFCPLVEMSFSYCTYYFWVGLLTYLIAVTQEHSPLLRGNTHWAITETQKIKRLWFALQFGALVVLTIYYLGLVRMQRQIAFGKAFSDFVQNVVTLFLRSTVNDYIICITHKTQMGKMNVHPFVKGVVQVQIG